MKRIKCTKEKKKRKKEGKGRNRWRRKRRTLIQGRREEKKIEKGRYFQERI